MDISKINPYIRAAKRSVIPARGEIKRRIIFDYELIYIESGSFLLRYNEKDYVCNPGTFLLLRPGIAHSFREINRDLSQPHIHFDMVYDSNSTGIPISFKDTPDLTPQEKSWIRKDIFHLYPQNPVVSFRDNAQALELFYQITTTPAPPSLSRRAKLLLLVELLILDNFPAVFEKNDTYYPIENEIRDYVDAGHGLFSSLEDFAKQFSYSKYYLERRFKDAFGVSLISYRNQKKLLYAKELLKSESVTAVSEKLGFSSIYAFSRAFKLHFGYPPSNIQKASR